jgi:dTDP-4-dehydrorhamnose reductase
VRRILVIGKNGQVGWELQRTLSTLGHVIAVDFPEIDLANPDSIRTVARNAAPNLIVNAAAYTAVDKAESEPEIAMAINGIAPGILAEEAKRLGAGMIHYSTDYVFDGTKTDPYTEEDAPNPLSVYGKTKLAGDQAIQAVGAPYLIFRTSWVYGARGKNFLLTILKLAQERDELKIVDDQIGAPTWARTIAEASSQVLAQGYLPQGRHPTTGVVVTSFSHDASGICNLSAYGRTSWYGFTKAILERTGKDRIPERPALFPITTEQYPLPARRPSNSLLSTLKIGDKFGIGMPPWETALRLCLDSDF